MAKNVSIWVDNEKFKEYAKIKAVSGFTWAEVLDLGVFAVSELKKTGDVDMGSGNWNKLFKKRGV